MFNDCRSVVHKVNQYHLLQICWSTRPWRAVPRSPPLPPSSLLNSPLHFLPSLPLSPGRPGCPSTPIPRPTVCITPYISREWVTPTTNPGGSRTKVVKYSGVEDGSKRTRVTTGDSEAETPEWPHQLRLVVNEWNIKILVEAILRLFFCFIVGI